MIKYPRVLVTRRMHRRLTKEAKRRKISIAELADKAFKKFLNHL